METVHDGGKPMQSMLRFERWINIHVPSEEERHVPYSNVTPEGLRETILHLLRNDDEIKQAILDLIRREEERHPRR
jgi:hypothetical protein